MNKRLQNSTSLGLAIAAGAAAVNATSAKALKAEVTNDARSHSVVSDSTPATPIAHTTVRIPLVWDEEADLSGERVS